ncbi:hypothetical protein EDC94DRAFT_521352 [Helicostylum pulchrum]|nr:hypothetical protein EDC94DRAFT_521352 [Helicostylum pulchrum]
MTSLGIIVKKENVKQVIEATNGREELVFCYDREYLDAPPEIISAFIEREISGLEPEIPFHSAIVLSRIRQTFDKSTMEDNCYRYIDFFEKLGSYSDSISDTIFTHQTLAKISVEEQKNQAMALNVALQNMISHIKLGTDATKIFLKAVKKEINIQANLLRYLDENVLILQNMNIHSPILDLLEPEFRSKVKLFDFIDTQLIESTKADTIELCKYLKFHSSKLKADIREIENFEKEIVQHVAENSHLLTLDDTLCDIKKVADTAHVCNKGIKPSLNKALEKLTSLKNEELNTGINRLSISTNSRRSPSVKKKFESLDHLADYQLDDPVPKLQKYDAIVRKNVAKLINSKRDSVTHFFKHMNVISDIQGCIAKLDRDSAANRSYLKDFKEKYGKNDLRSVRHAVLAYGALLIEIVRRKEYKQILIKNSNIIADILSDYRFKEEKRRDYFRHTIRNLLPFKLVGFDSTSPQSEITLNGINSQDRIQLDKKDVEEYISILDNAYCQQINSSLTRQPSFASPRTKKLSKSINVVESDDIMLLFSTMSQQLNDLKSDFLKTVESNCKLSFFFLNVISTLTLFFI